VVIDGLAVAEGEEVAFDDEPIVADGDVFVLV